MGYLLSQSTAPLKSFPEKEEVEGETKAGNPKTRSDPGGEDAHRAPQVVLVSRTEYKEQEPRQALGAEAAGTQDFCAKEHNHTVI